jgi:hypothetical protein
MGIFSEKRLRVPGSPALSNSSCEDDWTLFTDERSIYSMSNASSNSVLTVDSRSDFPPL